MEWEAEGEPQGSVAGPARDPESFLEEDAGLKQSRSRMHKVWRLACGDAERASNKNITLCPDKLVDCLARLNGQKFS